MTDCETGEILYNQEKILACQFVKNDTAFNLMHNVLESCVRGIRSNKVNKLELKIFFSESNLGNTSQLPFVDGLVF